MIRNFLLADCDWTQMPDAAIDADLKAQWTAYRTKLRQLPQDYDGQDADEVRFPINPVMYARFLTKRDDEGNLINEDKEYLATSDQFGIFSATTYGEYAKRIVMTIASNYKVKNPDVIFKPANFTQNFTDDQDELEALLRAVQESNV